MEFSADNLTAGEWIFILAVVFGAFIARGWTGLGSSALCVSFLTFVMPPAVAVILTIMLEMPAGLLLLPGARRHVDIKWLVPTIGGLFIGAPAGVWLLSYLDESAAQIAVYALAAFFVSANLANLLRRANAPLFNMPPLATGVIAGFANGLAAIAGIVVAVFLLSSGRTVQTIRASLIAMFIFTEIYSLALYASLGLFHPSHGVLFFAAMPPLLAGIFIGAKLFARSSGKHYRPLVLGLILFACAAGLLRLALGAGN
ncbi:MAG: sulfite exporter TauE/SafE family protein [Gammaproteobacteria bacterium]